MKAIRCLPGALAALLFVYAAWMGGRYRAGDQRLAGGLSAREAIARAQPLLAHVVPIGEHTTLIAEPLSTSSKPESGIRLWSVSYVDASGDELANVLLDGHTGRALYTCRMRGAGHLPGSPAGRADAVRRAKAWMDFQQPGGRIDPWLARHVVRTGDRWIVSLEQSGRLARVDVDPSNGQIWLATTTA